MEILVSTYGDRGVPHMEWIRRSNPGARVHVATGVGLRDHEHQRAHAWRNADRVIRDWWRENGATVQGDRIAIVEWDVLVRQHFELADAPRGPGLSGRDPKVWGAQPWCWWREVGRLPADLRSHRYGLAPLCALVATTACLDAIADSRWDHVFDLDIFCELRLPTVVRACGFEIGRVPAFDGCSCDIIPDPGTKPGFWHPIKHPVSK